MRCKIHPCHVTYSGRQLPPPIIKNPSSALTPRHRTIRITTAAATSPRARLIRAEKCGGGIVPVDDVDRIETEIEEIGKNSRRIRSKIGMINTSLEAVWSVLTDYERLSEFIPGLAVSELVEKKDSYARLFQIGQQKLAFGINFNAKGIVDCFEKDLETLPFGLRRDIEFKMIEGDFQLFEGKWSIEQYNVERYEDDNPFIAEEFRSTLSYVVDVEPKLWLPVSLVEGRLCKEIKTNLSCIREEAHKRS